MVEMSDQSTVQAWLIAIPSAVTAVSTWYINRKTRKTVGKSHEAITTKGDEMTAEIETLKERIDSLERTLSKVRDCQLLIAQKYTESAQKNADSLSSFKSDLQSAMRILNQFMTEGKPQSSGASSKTDVSGEEKKSGVQVVDLPEPPIGKVTWEK